MPTIAPPNAHAKLLHRIGGTVHSEPIPIRPDSRVQEIGSFCGLPVWATNITAPECASLARRLAGLGRIGLLTGNDQQRRRLLLAVTLSPVRLVAIPEEDTTAVIFNRLARLVRDPVESTLQQAVRCADALDLDAAGRSTFKLLHQLLETGIAHLPARIPKTERHAWLLIQLTRLLFLRFVESEGWLNDNPHFLLNQFDRCLTAGRNPFRHFLQPLFFGTLNREAGQRLRVAREFGAIPFLNGGLFEPHAVEERHEFVPPREYWEEVFDAITERIEVTLDPAASGGEVTPEMLGRVFEGVMDADERKASGAFYTPSSLVHALVRQALIPMLAERMGESDSRIEDRLGDPDIPLRQAMLTVRVLDPAVGSGAFLVGALDLLHGPGHRQPNRVRHLVTRSLHGVDRHPGAVRITELRLWLEVLRSLRGATPQQVPPLPNLDTTIRAGDALLDSVPGTSPLRQVTALASQQRALANAHGAAKRQLLNDIRHSERSAMTQLLRAREAQLHRGITELVELGQSQTLFGERTGLDHTDRKLMARLRQEWLQTRREVRSLERDATAAPFACAIAFAPILGQHGGFDLVVGNPPWVRAERLPAATRRELSARYRWWSGASGKGFQHQPDLAVAFVERSLQLLRPGGTAALVLPAKLATTRYASVMREGVTRQTTIRCVADLAGDSRALFQATTYPMALVLSRTPPAVNHSVRLGLNSDDAQIPQHAWVGAPSWTLRAPEAQAVVERLTQLHPPMRERITPQLGVKTGANEVFLNPPAHLVRWTRRVLRGRDVGGWFTRAERTRCPPADLARLLWPADDRGNPWPRLPSQVAEYLEPHRNRLQRRSDLHDECWWRLFRTNAATGAYRVVWSDLARELRAIALEASDIIPLNSCYVALTVNAMQARALCAWLNSPWIGALARLSADPAAQGFARFNARVISSLPLPATALDDEVLMNAGAGASAADARVAELLALTPTDQNHLASLASNRR